MISIHRINFDDITIADEYLNGHDHKRCKNALWSAYNVLKKMKNTPVSKGVYQVLSAICKSSNYISDTNVLHYTAVNFADFPVERHHYVIEDYGFAYSSFVFTDNYKPKGKPKLERAKHFTLSYTDGDFTDVIFGIKLFADICQNHTWPFFENADIRVAFKNASELGLPLGQRQGKAAIKEVCDYFMIDPTLKNGTANLLKLADDLKLKNRFVASDSCTFTYRGHNIFNFIIGETRNEGVIVKEEINNFYIRLVIGHKEAGEKFISSLPTEIKAEYLSNPTNHCENCKGCNWIINVENAGKTYQLCTCNFNYICHNPTAEQFKIYEKFIKLRKEFIDTQKAYEPKKEKKPTKPKSAISGEKTVFELTNKQQALVKPKIEDCRDYFLKDKQLNETFTQLVELTHTLCEAPKWRAKNRYDSRYKKRDLIKFRLEGTNDFNVTVFHESWREDVQDKINFILVLPEEIKKRYVNIKQAHCNQTHCNNSRESCMFHLDGLCYWFHYTFDNPTPEQIKDIEFLADLMKGYISSKALI